MRRQEQAKMIYYFVWHVWRDLARLNIDWNVREKSDLWLSLGTSWNVVLSKDYLKLTLFNEDLFGSKSRCWQHRFFLAMNTNHPHCNSIKSWHFFHSFTCYSVIRMKFIVHSVNEITLNWTLKKMVYKQWDHKLS